MQQMDDPPYLSVGTEVSAKYKGAFCEAKVRKVVRNIKCKVAYKQGLGTGTVSDDQIKGDILRVGAVVEVKHPDRRDFVEATITKIQDCSQYTVVFDDGDITTLRRSALCLKSGRHFNESETLDQLPLTHPEHFGNPVIGGRRGRSCRSRQLQDESSEDEDDQESKEIQIEKEEHIGKVVCVESTDTKKKGPKENWFPALVVSPTTQDTVRIRVKEEYLVRSFKDGRYYTVPKKEATEFTREMSHKQDGQAIQAALEYLDNDVLPPHWDRDALFGLGTSSSDFDQEFDSDSSDDEPREEKDHFVAQLYKYMDDRGTPLNKGPSIVNRDVDLYRLFRAVDKLGGYNRVTGQNQWKSIAIRLGFSPATTSITNLVKQAYKKFLQPFEEFNRKLGCTMVAYPRANRIKGRSLVRANSVASPKPVEQKDTEKIVKQQTSTLATPIQADESENNSEPETKHPVKRKLSTGNTTNIGKVKAMVDKFDAKSTETASYKEADPSPTVDVIPTIPTSRMPVSKLSQKVTEEPRTSISTIISTPPSVTLKKEKDIKEKAVEVKEAPAKEKPIPIEKSISNSGISKTDKNNDKRGRKKKDNEPPEKFEKAVEKSQEKTIEKKDLPAERDNQKEATSTALTDFPIEVGDKLKVYYHEQKVTYEAKVIEISDQGTPLYLVHYTGWNTRYDEWVPKERIAENLSNNKIKRTKSNASRSSSSNNSNVGSTTPTSNPNKSSAKRGRGGSRSDSQPPRSTTPSSVASNSSRTKSPATPAQRRTTRGQPSSMRRTSNNTDISSVQTESDTDSDEPVKKPQSRISTNNSINKSNTTTTLTSSSPSTTAPSMHIGANSRSSSSQDEESFSASKGVDYDLNQIRSELKGIRKIKSPSPDVERLLITKIEPDIKQETPNDKMLSVRDLSNQTSLPTKATSSCSDTKNTSSDLSTDSESLGGDDDSQSSLDKTIATVKNEAKFAQSDSKGSIVQPSSLTGKTLSIFSSIIEKPVLKEIKALVLETERDSKPVLDVIEKIEETITIKPSIFSSKLSDSILNQKPNIDKMQSTIKTEKPTIPLSSLKTEKKIIMSEKLNRDKLIKVSAEKLPSSIGSSLSISSDSVKLQQQPVCDIYEFKEPEPFEYETTTTPSKKQPILVDSSSTSNLSAEKRCGKVLGVKTEKIIELKTNLNITPTPISVPTPLLVGGKRKKNSPNKELDFKSFKQIKKEEGIGSPTEEYGSTPVKMNTSTSSSSSIESTFDVLRKSPSFNMRGGSIHPGECNTLPQLSPAIESLNSQIKSNFFSSSIDFESTKPKSDKKLFEDMLCDVPSTSMMIPVKTEEKSIMKEAVSSADSDLDSPVHGKDFVRVKELLTVETFDDLEPPKIEKIPSIADRVLKALNQQSGCSKQEIKPSSERIFSPTPLSTSSSLTATSLPFKPHNPPIVSEIVKPSIIDSIQTSKSLEIPLISIDTYPKKSITSNPISMFSANVGTSSSTDILESISPKNNDLSETIQKLESAIKKTIPTSVQPVNIDRFNDDSSESTDSEQRLIIEDESLSSETQGVLTANSSTGCSVSNLPIQSQQPHQDTIESENNFSSIKFNHQEGAISIFSSTQSTIIHSQLDKQQMTAVEFLTTGMIDRENERLSLLHNAANNQDSILSQAQHINPSTTQINLMKKEESQPNTHTNNTFLQEQTQQNESLSMLLCEETIPGSPAPVCTNTIVSSVEQTKKPYDNQAYITQNPHPTSSDIKPVPMEIENDLLSAAKTVEIKIEINALISEINVNPGSSCTGDINNPNIISSKTQISAQKSVSVSSGQGVSSVRTNSRTGSPRDSLSPEDSKSEGESDIKKREHGLEINRISPKKRRRQRKSSELENTAHNNNNNNNHNNNTSNTDNDNENINTNNTINSSHNTSNINNSSSNTNISANNNSSSKRRKIPHARKHTNGSDSEDNNFDVSALQQRISRRSPKPCQYNFLVEFDVTLSSAQRINIIKKKIQEVRKTYNMVKAELASIDRRRKKLRRREREKNKLAKATAS